MLFAPRYCDISIVAAVHITEKTMSSRLTIWLALPIAPTRLWSYQPTIIWSALPTSICSTSSMKIGQVRLRMLFSRFDIVAP